MTTAYSPILKLALPVTGELDGAWGDVVNDNITSMLEEAIAGLASISTWAGASHTLTTADGTTSESRCAILQCSGAPGAAATVVCPAVTKLYVLKNEVTGGYAVTLKTASGTGISVPNGKAMWLYCDGTNVVDATTHLSSLTLGSALPVASGGTAATTAAGARVSLLPTYAGNAGKVLAVNGGATDTEWIAAAVGSVTSVATGTGLTGGPITVSGTISIDSSVVTLTGTQSLSNKTLTNPTVTNYVETLYTATGSTTVDLANGTVQKITTNGNITVTLPASVAGKSFVVMIAYGGNHTVTWAGGGTLKWANGTAPTQTKVNGKIDVFTFIQDGTNTLGSTYGANF